MPQENFRLFKSQVMDWSVEDCANYIEKHEKDSRKSARLMIELCIVRSRVSELAPDLDANRRKQIFKTWDYKEIVKYLSDSAPRRCRDDYHREWKPGIHPNIGIYLWAMGYNVTRPLGAGSFGCVWECDGKAVKVMLNGMAANLEILTAEKMAKLINNDTSGKCKKYFNYLVSKDPDNPILEAILANGDLWGTADERIKSGRAESKKSTKTIASVLRQLRQVAKALIKLHELGYSHNDVKPGNFLKIDKASLGIANKISKYSKEHKHRTQLADFGGITKIPGNGEELTEEHLDLPGCTEVYSPNNIGYESTREEIEKRDVFALGVSGLELLLQKTPRKYHLEHKEMFKYTDDSTYNDFELGKYYGGTSKENMMEFLGVLRKMANENYKQRPTLEEALRLLQQINPGK